MTEFLEVIDEKNRVLRLAPRRQCHEQGLLHKAVHVHVFDSKGRLYLQKRGASTDRFPLYWDSSCAGHVSPRESLEDAANRELEEELGLRGKLVKKMDLRWHLRYKNLVENEFIRLYYLVTQKQPKPRKGELAGGKWVSLRKLDEMIASKKEKVAPSLEIIRWFSR
ncbi:NUDIX domain-containing protein [Candidatus Micrarchaeota archaeon]|nr:NUDIX domain-containing protein [Candidatus Micrarchaeota archaeon]